MLLMRNAGGINIPTSIASCCMSSVCHLRQRVRSMAQSLLRSGFCKLTMSADLIWAVELISSCFCCRSTRFERKEIRMSLYSTLIRTLQLLLRMNFLLGRHICGFVEFYALLEFVAWGVRRGCLVDVSVCAFSRRETNEIVKIRPDFRNAVYGWAQNRFCLMLRLVVDIFYFNVKELRGAWSFMLAGPCGAPNTA